MTDHHIHLSPLSPLPTPVQTPWQFYFGMAMNAYLRDPDAYLHPPEQLAASAAAIADAMLAVQDARAAQSLSGLALAPHYHPNPGRVSVSVEVAQSAKRLADQMHVGSEWYGDARKVLRVIAAQLDADDATDNPG